MLITRIKVSGLFNYFEHDLVFKPNEQITIMIGPNGFGKTMILRLVNTLFNLPVRTLGRMPFQSLTIYFDSGSKLSVSRTVEDSKIPGDLELVYEKPTGKKNKFKPKFIVDPSKLNIPISAIEDVIPELDQVSARSWVDISTDSVLELDEVIQMYGHRLPWEGDTSVAQPDWFTEILTTIPVRFIDTERLTQIPSRRHPRMPSHWHEERNERERTVRRYSEELGKHVQKTLSEYGSHAQSLDRTFPVRLVEELHQADVSMDKLRKELAEVEQKRSSLVNAGLLVQEHEAPEVPSLDKVDESKRGVLAVYAQDAKEKLSIFDDLYLRIDALKRISNSRLLYKQVAVGPDGLNVISSNGSSLELETLSSGEQHELVILYELLFRVPDNSFILFDEPELSLHVAWQDKFLEDLGEMAKISKFQALLATHSPEIIGDRWDLAVELKGPENT